MFEIGLSYIRQHEDTTEWGADEPYVIIFAADLADTGFIPIPAAKTTLNGPYEMGEVVGFPVSPAHPAKAELCWGFNGQPRDIDHPDNPLILVALMESDHVDSPPDFANSVRAGTDGVVLANLIGHIADRNAGTMSLAELRSQLIDDMRGAVDIFKKADIEYDERLGPVQLLPITAQDLVDVHSHIVEKKLTFVSEAEESEYELTFRIGYGVGSVSSGLSSGGPMDRYAAIWTKEPGPAWVARHRMTSAKYQQEFNKLTSQGFRLVHISGYNFGGQARFAAIWEKSQGPAWAARHNMTAKQYQQEFDKHVKLGYRLIQVSAYRGLGQDLYAAIWRKEFGSSNDAGSQRQEETERQEEMQRQGETVTARSEFSPSSSRSVTPTQRIPASGPAWVARHRMTAARYQNEFNKLAQKGFRLVDISGCRIADHGRYAAIWEKKASPPWVARHGTQSSSYQQEFDNLVGQGFRLRHINGFRIGGQVRFATIWEKSQGPAWVARHNMTAEQYQQEFDKQIKLGYRLVCVSGY